MRRPDNDFALAWVKSHGKGRVLDAIQFAIGDLEGATAPSAPPPPADR